MITQQFPNIWLTDLASVQRLMMTAKSSGTWTDEENDLLAQVIEQASSDIVYELGWLPLPTVDTLKIDWSSAYISRDSRQLWVSSDALLLEITTLTNGDTEVLTSAKYVLEPNNRFPKRVIRLLSTGSTLFRPKTDGQWEQAITVAGIFGYVPHYATCWQTTGQTVQNTTQLAAGATALQVTDASSFSRGQYLQMGSETVVVEDVDTSTTPDSITIIRAVLGTTDAAHLNGVAINRFQHNRSIQLAATEWAAYLYKTKDQIEQQVEVYDGSVTLSRGLRKTVYNALLKHSQVMVQPL